MHQRMFCQIFFSQSYITNHSHQKYLVIHRSMLYHPSCRVIAAQLPVGHPVHFLSNKSIYVVRNIGNTAKFSIVLC